MVKQTKLTGKLKKAVDKEINKKIKAKIEPKATDLTLGSQALSSNAISLLVTQVAQGTGNTNRIGNKIKIRHIDINLQFNGAVNTVNPPFNNIRQVILQDNNDDGSLFGTTDLLANNNPYSLVNFNNTSVNKRFKILSDKNISLNKYATPALFYTSTSQKLMRIRIPGSKCGPVCYNGASGTANASKGQVWILWMTDSLVDTPFVYYNTRVIFEDM